MASARSVMMFALLGVCLLFTAAHAEARFTQFDSDDQVIPNRAARFNGLRYGLGYVKSVQSARAKPHDGFSPLLLSINNMDGPFGNSRAADTQDE